MPIRPSDKREAVVKMLEMIPYHGVRIILKFEYPNLNYIQRTINYLHNGTLLWLSRRFVSHWRFVTRRYQDKLIIVQVE